MINSDEQSNANLWELEVLVQNKEMLIDITQNLAQLGVEGFEARQVGETLHAYEKDFECKYTLLIWGCWFNNLHYVTKMIKKVEKKYDKFK